MPLWDRLVAWFATRVTRGDDGLVLRVLGPLELRVGAERLSVRGGRERTLLATLLLRAGEIVPAEALVDELWGDNPPPSASHGLEVYVSRLRRVLNGHGAALVRKGAGYVVELGDAQLDAARFGELVEAAAASRDPASARELAGEALSLWRGRALADVDLGPSSRSAAGRLEEQRLRVLEVRIDADLALGRHREVVGELQALVAEHPNRERFVGHLMLALYGCGRPVDALDVYERTRRWLDDELGLRPSADLQQLSARIVRQDPELRAAWHRVGPPARDATPETYVGRRALAVAAGAVAVAVLAVTATGAASHSPGAPAARIALVLQSESRHTGYGSARAGALTDALYDIAASEALEPTLVELSASPTRSQVASTARWLEDGRFALVLIALDRPTTASFVPAVTDPGATRFVVLDGSLHELGLDGHESFTAVRFASEQPAQLAGALSGLFQPRAGQKPDVVSVVAGMRTHETVRVVTAFRRGLSRALPEGELRVEYTGETADPTSCERAANRQIDAGADVLFVHAGRCGAGALAVARARSVWAIASDGIGRAGDNVIGAAFEDWDNALFTAAHAFVEGALPAGRDVALGLDGYNVGLEMHSSLSPEIASEVVDLCSDLRVLAKERIRTYSEP
jgi:DNA-binding SARP family transcriptional activator/basic membrane lipoprotein Med (substrate-binding protein (PBP1-ABC) superfamily)